MMDAIYELTPEVKRYILWVDTYTVENIANWTGKLYGPAISTGQTPDQVGAKRPPIRTPVKGLYVCGDCAGARGIGTELATQSGIECSDEIIRDKYFGMS